MTEWLTPSFFFLIPLHSADFLSIFSNDMQSKFTYRQFSWKHRANERKATGKSQTFVSILTGLEIRKLGLCTRLNKGESRKRVPRETHFRAGAHTKLPPWESQPPCRKSKVRNSEPQGALWAWVIEDVSWCSPICSNLPIYVCKQGVYVNPAAPSARSGHLELLSKSVYFKTFK